MGCAGPPPASWWTSPQILSRNPLWPPSPSAKHTQPANCTAHPAALSYGKTKLGSVSEDLSVKAPCSTLVIKDRGDAAGGAANTTFSGAGARTLAGMLAPAAARGAAGSLERCARRRGGGGA